MERRVPGVVVLPGNEGGDTERLRLAGSVVPPAFGALFRGVEGWVPWVLSPEESSPFSTALTRFLGVSVTGGVSPSFLFRETGLLSSVLDVPCSCPKDGFSVSMSSRCWNRHLNAVQLSPAGQGMCLR